MRALPDKRSTVPLKTSPEPIGISSGTASFENCSLISPSTDSKFAAALSIIETTKIRGISLSSQYSHTFSVPINTPLVASTRIAAPSATRTPAFASPAKSTYPGVSIRLIFVFDQVTCATAMLIVMPWDFSSGVKSVIAVPSGTDPFRSATPAV